MYTYEGSSNEYRAQALEAMIERSRIVPVGCTEIALRRARNTASGDDDA